MDISKFDDVSDLESAVCPINHPVSGEYLFSLQIAGASHPVVKKYSESEGRSLAHQSKALGNFQKAMDARTETVLTDSNVALQRTVKNLLVRTLGWTDMTDTSGATPLKYDEKQMQVWYEEKQWLRDTVTAFIGESRNFVKGSSGN